MIRTLLLALAVALAPCVAPDSYAQEPAVSPTLGPTLSPTVSPAGEAGAVPYYPLGFDGGDRVAISGVTTKLANRTTGTIAVWLKAIAGTQITAVAITNGGATRTDITVQLVDRKPFAACTVDGTAQWRWLATNALTAGTWYHVAVTHNGTTPTVFVNGVAVAGSFTVTTDKTDWWKSAITDATNKAAIALIGSHYLNSAYTERYTSKLAQIVFSSSVWTAADAAAAMNDATVDRADLGYYRMEPGTGTTVTDNSGGGSTGTFPGGAANPAWGVLEVKTPPTGN